MTWQVLTHRRPVAVKEHMCFYCERTIDPGEQYHLMHGICDRAGASMKWCAQCDRLTDALFQVESDDGVPLLDWAEEYLSSAGLDDLATAFGAGWATGDGARVPCDHAMFDNLTTILREQR